ncbi:MAG: peptidoglycan hydrolase CwlO-like protein [Marivirga sp.]|jgi:peptidoglycan hydrolase CwlO-like protein
MKKTILFLTFLGLVFLSGCGQSTSENENTTTIEKEQELANEAKDESMTAKEDAEATEESVDKLLEDI